jgi:hypothetical protein
MSPPHQLGGGPVAGERRPLTSGVGRSNLRREQALVQENTIFIESDWMASAQLDGLVAATGAESFGLTYDVASATGHRGVEVPIIVAAVSGLFNVLVPFMAKLAERLFATEPDARLVVGGARGENAIVLTADMPAENVAVLLAKAIDAGARNVKISISDKPA